MIQRKDFPKSRVYRNAPHWWVAVVPGPRGVGVGLFEAPTWREAYDFAHRWAVDQTHHLEPCS